MMHPDFWSVADHAKQLGFRNHLLTNGTFVTAINAAMLAVLFSYIKISLDGASEATHAKTRGPDHFDAVMRMGRGVLSTLEEIISNEQFHKISRQVDVQDGRGAKRLQNGQRSLGCYAGDAHISVADNGDVYPCHLFHQNAFKMGKVFVDNIADIFRSPKMMEFGASMDVENNNARCSSCDFRYLCGGGCKANPLHAHRDYRKSDTFCGFIRNSLLDEMFSGYAIGERGVTHPRWPSPLPPHP